jgi:hypothetical protein
MANSRLDMSSFSQATLVVAEVASAVGASTSHHVMPAADTVLGIDHNVIDSEHLSMLIVNL